MASPKRRQRHVQKYQEAREKGLDHQKLKKRAAELRRAEERKSAAPRRKVRRGDWEDLVEGDAAAFDLERRRSASTEAWLARLEAEQAALAEGADGGAQALAARGLVQGTVASVASGACRVALADGQVLACTLADDLRRRQRSAVAVGDRALVDVALARVRHVLPRATSLSRPDPADPSVERVLAANVDLALVVASLREPRLSVGLVERVVLAVARGGATAVVCVTKVDLASDAARRADELRALDPLVATGVRVLPCSARTGEGLAELRALARGRTCVLVGHSGVGKSTLLNALAPELGLAVGRVRAADGKGRHTTSASSLHLLTDGTRVIDTPGVRQFGLWRITRAELSRAFPDVASAAEACRFRDCSHVHEPGCGVRTAVAGGALPAARFASYVRIRETL